MTVTSTAEKKYTKAHLETLGQRAAEHYKKGEAEKDLEKSEPYYDKAGEIVSEVVDAFAKNTVVKVRASVAVMLGKAADTPEEGQLSGKRKGEVFTAMRKAAYDPPDLTRMNAVVSGFTGMVDDYVNAQFEKRLKQTLGEDHPLSQHNSPIGVGDLQAEEMRNLFLSEIQKFFPDKTGIGEAMLNSIDKQIALDFRKKINELTDIKVSRSRVD